MSNLCTLSAGGATAPLATFCLKVFEIVKSSQAGFIVISATYSTVDRVRGETRQRSSRTFELYIRLRHRVAIKCMYAT